MELQEFVKTTLVQITNGIIEAQKELKETGCIINPGGNDRFVESSRKGYVNEHRKIEKIKMNVVLSISDSEESSAKLGVAKIFHAGIDSGETKSNQNTTSIEFTVPIQFPVMDETKS